MSAARAESLASRASARWLVLIGLALAGCGGAPVPSAVAPADAPVAASTLPPLVRRPLCTPRDVGVFVGFGPLGQNEDVVRVARGCLAVERRSGDPTREPSERARTRSLAGRPSHGITLVDRVPLPGEGADALAAWLDAQVVDGRAERVAAGRARLLGEERAWVALRGSIRGYGDGELLAATAPSDGDVAILAFFTPEGTTLPIAERLERLAAMSLVDRRDARAHACLERTLAFVVEAPIDLEVIGRGAEGCTVVPSDARSRSVRALPWMLALAPVPAERGDALATDDGARAYAVSHGLVERPTTVAEGELDWGGARTRWYVLAGRMEGFVDRELFVSRVPRRGGYVVAVAAVREGDLEARRSILSVLTSVRLDETR